MPVPSSDSAFRTTSFPAQDEAPEPTSPSLKPAPRIGWRRRALLVAAVIACLTVFLLARVMAHNPHLDAEWRSTADGRIELSYSAQPALKDHQGATLAGIVDEASGAVVPFDALALTHSSRWIAEREICDRLNAARGAAALALSSGRITLAFADGSRAGVDVQARGYAELGSMFWLMCAFALVLFLIGWIVPLVQPRGGNLLYALMALAQSAQLLVSAIASVPGLAMPPPLAGSEPGLRTLLDAITGAAMVTTVAWHPVRLPGRQAFAGAAWAATAGLLAWLLAHGGDAPWWACQSLLLGEGLLCAGLLGWSYRRLPHPFALVMRRFCVVTVSTLLLLVLAVSSLRHLPPDVQPLALSAAMIWTVFLASVVVLVPFVSRSHQVMREFAMLAGVSTVATSVDLLFVAVFSFSQFTSLTLSLFLALGAYAALRQWLMNQMMGARAVTTERMFEHLYRIAREVEARPERAGERMAELLRNVFEPLEAVPTGGRETQSRVSGNGAVLLVPVPNLVQGPRIEGTIALRFAERGKRLFTPEDARLADRIVEQLMRALAHDRAVERGRSEERARIAQDLHDDIGARLLTLMYKAPSKEMEDYVRHTLQDLKTLTRGLAAREHPLALAAAEWKTDITQRLGVVRCELEWESSFDEDVVLTITQWSALTRILRELVSNAIAHAQARHIRIEVQFLRGELNIRIIDDGIGRDPSHWSPGLGLGGVRKRVKLLGGSVQWHERQPRGILCSVTVPHLGSSNPTPP